MADPAITDTATASATRPRVTAIFRSRLGLAGSLVIAFMLASCLGTLWWTLGADTPEDDSRPVARYRVGETVEARLPPIWAPKSARDIQRLNSLVEAEEAQAIADRFGVTLDDARAETSGEIARAMREHWPTRDRTAHFALGTDQLGRSLFVRLLAGGGISLTIGIAAALVSVFIGTIYGAIAGYAGGKIDALMMRIVDVLYGLPYILLVVILAVASDAFIEEWSTRQKARAGWVESRSVELYRAHYSETPGAFERGMFLADPVTNHSGAEPGLLALAVEKLPVIADRGEQVPADIESWIASEPIGAILDRLATAEHPERRLTEGTRNFLDLLVLLIAIGGVSWLTLARVVRGQVLSLKNQPFVEAARAVGAPKRRIFLYHLLPNLIGPIVVYATLAVPQAILQESFLSFLGIGVKPPMPSWGNLAAEGLGELNTHNSDWWLLLMPCLLLAMTLLALNFVGEGLREALDPKRKAR